MAASMISVLIAGYGIGKDTAIETSRTIIDSTSVNLLTSLLSRFSNYESPSNAFIAVIASWLTSPLTLFAGYIFTARIIKDNIINNAPANRLSLLVRIAVLFLIFIIGSYTIIMLPGFNSIYCRGCEQSSMLFMLIVRVVGFWCAGAVFGAATVMLTTYLSKEH